MHVGGVLHIIDYIDIIYIFINAPGFTKNISAAHDQNYVFQFLISESKTWSIDDNTINAHNRNTSQRCEVGTYWEI